MNQICAANACPKRFLGHPQLLSALAIFSLLVTAFSARADDPDGQYLHVFDLIQQGDTLKKNGQVDPALAKYREAQIDLLKFQRAYPERNAKLVSYRLTYLSTQITSLASQSSGAAPPTETPSTPKAAPATPAALVKLLDKGAEPRKELRLHPKPGDKQSMVMTMKIGMAVQIGEMENPPVKLPVIKMTMDLTVKDVAPNGDINYDLVMSDAGIVEDPDVLAQVAEAMRTALAGMKGLGGKGTISNRGISKGTDIKAPQGADPQVNQFVDQMKETMSRVATPLPEEPVGAGAKWEVKMPIKSQGMTINQTESFELVSLDADRGAAKTSVTQTASNQKIQNPVMPGTKVDLTKMTGNGTGELTFDLAQILPAEASVQFHQDMSMSMTAANASQKQTMDMKMDLNLHIESK